MSDNEGRRNNIRDYLSHDPFYRRIKDALLMILALLGVCGMSGYDLKSVLTGVHKDQPRSEMRENVMSRLVVLETKVETMEKTVGKFDDKLDRLLESRWRGP